MRSHHILIWAISAAALPAGTIGVTVEAASGSATLGMFQDTVGLENGVCADLGPDWPCEATIQNLDGFNILTLILPTAASSSVSADGIGTSSASAFASVSVTEGHAGMSFAATSTGLGKSIAQGTAIWSDVLTIGGLGAVGTPVTLVANLNIEAAFLASGQGGTSVSACFGMFLLFSLCSSGSDNYGESLVVPLPQTATFTAHIGDVLDLGGRMDGQASAYNAPVGGTSDYEVVASHSAHYKITSLTPGVTLTLGSGCSITSGNGCDSAAAGVPEPDGWWLAGVGLLGIAVFRRRGTAS
jgi:MYXO-CTERM domain-containing protein